MLFIRQIRRREGGRDGGRKEVGEEKERDKNSTFEKVKEEEEGERRRRALRSTGVVSSPLHIHISID